jgi:ketosteroid isomerase-like protein
MKTPKSVSLTMFVAALACFLGTAGAARQDAARVAIASQSRALMAAIDKGDAIATAALFTRDALLSVQGIQGVLSGRAAITGFWKSALGGGLGGLTLVTADVIGDGGLRVETGSYTALGADRAELGHGQYLLVWQKEDGDWKIARDFAHSTGSPPTAANAPSVGGREFPRDYALHFRKLGGTLDDENHGLTTVYANAIAASTADTEASSYPDGSVILMEFAEAQRDGEEQLIRDAHGQLVKGMITHVDVMRRGAGFGSAYGDSRAGQWEFSSYGADGSTLIPPEKGAHCAACHLRAGAAKDFVYRLRSWSPVP